MLLFQTLDHLLRHLAVIRLRCQCGRGLGLRHLLLGKFFGFGFRAASRLRFFLLLPSFLSLAIRFRFCRLFLRLFPCRLFRLAFGGGLLFGGDSGLLPQRLLMLAIVARTNAA